LTTTYNELQSAVLITLTVKVWRHKYLRLPRWLRPKLRASAKLGAGYDVPSWEPVEIPLAVYRKLDAYLNATQADFDLVIHDVGITNQPLEVSLEEAARLGAHA
jgi:hypothetical protein